MMTCRQCNNPPCHTCLCCANCKCTCVNRKPLSCSAPHTSAKTCTRSPGITRRIYRNSPTAPTPAQLIFADCSNPVATPTEAAPSPSTHSCLVSSNDRSGKEEMKFESAKVQLRMLCQSLNLDSALYNHLHYESPGTKFKDVPNRAALALMKAVIEEVTKIVAPHDPQGLAASFMTPGPISPLQTVHAMLTDNIIAAMKSTKRGTMSRRYIRSVLCGTMARSDVNEVLGYPPENGEQNASVLTSGPFPEKTGSQRKNSVEGEEEEDEEEGDDDSGDDTKLPRISAKTFSRARRDWATLLEARELQPATFGRARVGDESLEHLLKFLFASENVVLVSWSRQRIIANGKLLNLPAVVASKTGGVLHDAYGKLMQSKNKKSLSRGSFYAVARTLTRREVRRVFPIDNITQTLLRDPLVLLRDIIQRTIPNQQRSSYFKLVDKVEWFLLNSFQESHIGIDKAGCHDLDFALRSDILQNDICSMMHRSVTCRGCVFPFQLLADIRRVAEIPEDHLNSVTIDECHARMMHYLGLMCRKAAQARQIEKEFNEIVSKNRRNRAIVFLNNLTHAEADCIGKPHLIPDVANLSMHGSVVFFIGKKTVDTEIEQDFGTSVLETRLYTHMVVDDLYASRGEVVAPALEALLYRISMDIPSVEELIFISDNSPTYKSDIVPCIVPHLAQTRGLRVLRYIYSCSQLCEFLTDAQFEIVMSVAHSNVGRKEIITPEDVVQSVTDEQKIISVSAELLSLGSDFQASSAHLGENRYTPQLLGDKNDIIYQDRQVSDRSNPEVSGSVTARIYSFAGIGNGVSFQIRNSSVRAPQVLEENFHSKAGNAPPPNTGVSWIGPVTGVQIGMNGKRLDELCQPRISLQNGVTEGVVEDAILRLRDWRELGAMKIKSVNTESGSLTSKSTVSTGRTCADCRRSFKSESFQKFHNCKGSSLEKDFSARAVAVACKMFSEGKLPIFRDASENLKCYQDKQISNVWFGWATPALPKDALESSTTLQYKKEVFEMLAKPGECLVPGEVRGELKSKYRERTDIPKEKRLREWFQLHDAIQRIQPFYVAPMAGAALVSFNDELKCNGSGRSRMNVRYAAKITAMHEEQMTKFEFLRLKPRNMYMDFEKLYRDRQGRLPTDFPGQKQVLNKINALWAKS